MVFNRFEIGKFFRLFLESLLLIRPSTQALRNAFHVGLSLVTSYKTGLKMGYQMVYQRFGEVINRVEKNAEFGRKLGKEFGKQTAHPHPIFSGAPPGKAINVLLTQIKMKSLPL